MELLGALFKPKFKKKKKKKDQPWKIFSGKSFSYISENLIFLAIRLKLFLYYLFFVELWKWKFFRKFLHFGKCNILASSYLMHFLSSILKTEKNIHPKKISFTLGKWNFLTLILIFLYIFSKEGCSYISGNENPEKINK